jgi:hypothetical protein
MDFKTGFWITAGILAALAVLGLVYGWVSK